MAPHALGERGVVAPRRPVLARHIPKRVEDVAQGELQGEGKRKERGGGPSRSTHDSNSMYDETLLGLFIPLLSSQIP